MTSQEYKYLYIGGHISNDMDMMKDVKKTVVEAYSWKCPSCPKILTSPYQKQLLSWIKQHPKHIILPQ